MAETIGTISGSIKQSIATVELQTRATVAQKDWSITYTFEDGTYNADGSLNGEPDYGTRRVTRNFGDIANVSVSAGGATATVAQIAALVKAAGYLFRKENVDKGIDGAIGQLPPVPHAPEVQPSPPGSQV